MLIWCWLGYDPVLLEPLHHADMRPHNANYGPMEVSSADLDFDPLDEVPPPPSDGQVAAAWYDTDL